MSETTQSGWPLDAVLPGLGEVAAKWWREWEDANLQPDGRDGLGYDIEQGWEAAWDCIEQHLPALLAKYAAEVMQEAVNLAYHRGLAPWAAVQCLNERAAEYRAMGESGV